MLLPKILLIFGISAAILFSITFSFDEKEDELEIDLNFDFHENDEENNIITPEIEAENNKLFKEFVFKQFTKIDDRIERIAAYLGKYYLKTDKNDDFGEIYYEINSQKRVTETMMDILKNPKSNNFKIFVTKDVEMHKKIIEKLKKSTLKIEESLETLKHWESFENIFPLLDQQFHDIQLLKDVIENPSKLPKQSHLLLKKEQIIEEFNGTNEYYNGISKMAQSDNKIFGFAVGEAEGDYVNLTIFGSQTQQPLGIIVAEKEKFVNEFLQIFKHPKFSSIILQIDRLSNHVEYVIKLREKLNSLDLPYIFISIATYMHSSIMIAAGLDDVKVDESIVIVLVDDENYVVTEFKHTVRGYLEGQPRDCNNIKKMSHESIEKRIIGTNNPAKIILHSNTRNMASMKLLKHKILKKYSKKLIILEEDLANYATKFAFETEKYLSDNSQTKYFISPLSFRKYMIGFECGGKRYPLIVCKKDEILPFKKTVMIPKTPLRHFLAHTDDYDKNLVIDRYFQLSPETQGYRFSLEVDENNFLKFDNRPFFSGKIPKLAKFLDKKDDFKIPVIAFHFELSFIYLFDDETGGYKLLDSWNGKLGKDLFISFDEKKPKFFEKATKTFRSKCNSVVHDIIQTMAKPLPRTFGYSIKTSDDSENPILFEYTNFDGTKKTETPASIMSKLLKEHLKAIEYETGEFPLEIAFTILDEFKDKKEMDRIKKQLSKSCDLINLYCDFVDTDFVSLVYD